MAAEMTISPAITTAISLDAIKSTMNDILNGVVAVVDVRHGYDNYTNVVASFMRAMGATIVKHFSKKVTHVIFSEGKQSLYNKAKENGIHLLSVLWIDGCIKEGKRVSEEQFPAFVDESYWNPLIKRKILRSIQPLDYKEAMAKVERKIRRKERLKNKKMILDPNVPLASLASPSPSFEVRLPPIDYYPGLIVYDSSSEDEEHAGVVPPPLARRLLNKFPDSPVLLEAYRRRDEKHARLKEEKRLRESGNFDTFKVEKLDIGNEVANKKEKLSIETPLTAENSSKRKRTIAFSTSESEIEDKFHEMKLSRTKEKGNFDCILGRGRPSIEEFKIRKPKAKRLNFTSVEGNSTKRNSIEPVSDLPIMVLTSFKSGERQHFNSIVQKLGKFRLSDTVGENTTHVICGDVRRTLNVIYGTVYGCWLLSSDWLLKSFEAGKWIEEEPYELFEHFPTAQICRLEKVLEPSFRCKIFSDVESIFVCSDTTFPAKDLRHILLLAGAKVVNCHRSAKIVIGQEFRRLETDVVCVSELWALNSISANKTLPLNDFRLKFNNI